MSQCASALRKLVESKVLGDYFGMRFFTCENYEYDPPGRSGGARGGGRRPAHCWGRQAEVAARGQGQVRRSGSNDEGLSEKGWHGLYDANFGAKIHDAELGAKIHNAEPRHISATSDCHVTQGHDLGVMTHGAETYYLDAMTHGAKTCYLGAATRGCDRPAELKRLIKRNRHHLAH